jgi:hypothetical protein
MKKPNFKLDASTALKAAAIIVGGIGFMLNKQVDKNDKAAELAELGDKVRDEVLKELASKKG